MVRGWVFNIQRYCLHDGPGIRTTVFLKGCPLRCSWCHNPESQATDPVVDVLESRCVRCGQCLDACPQGGRPEDRRRLRPDEESDAPGQDCTRCGACVSACPTGARQMVGRLMSVSEVVDAVARDGIFHDQSQGGVTLSGGEPLLQTAFVLQLLQAFRERSIHTALDTCGFAAESVIREVAPWVNLFLYDLKSVDDGPHLAQTGVSNRPILRNLETLASLHANIWIRIPLVPGFNLEREQLQAAARYIAGLPAIQQVNLLPYHSMGTRKRGPTGDNGAPRSGDEPVTTAITPEQIEATADLFRAAGLHTVVGG